MKNYLLNSLFLIFLVAFVPFFTLISFNTDASDTNTLSHYDTVDTSVRVLQVSSQKILNMDITEYLIGAVASEMPASFNEEALKAQAVASYTYLKWIMLNSDNGSRELWDISDDSSAHQGFLTTEQMKERWEEKYDTYYSKIKKAVEGVKNEYIAYEGQPVLAAFHGLSPGTTSDSKDVWGNSLPYLISVEAPGDKLSPDLICVNSFTYSEIKAIIEGIDGLSTEDIDKKEWIKVLSAAESGYVKEVSVGNGTLSGTELKALLKLKSPNFTVNATDSKVEFTVYGKGHGLGMSQYSADFMARQGYNYKEIIEHFYPNTELLKD